MTAYTDQQLFEYLNELKVIDDKLLANALTESKQFNKPLDEILVSKDLLTDENLGKAIADMISVPLIRLNKHIIQDEILNLLPEDFAKNQRAITFKVENKTLSVAFENPLDKETVEHVQKKWMGDVKIYYATKRDIDETLAIYAKNKTKKANEEEQVQELLKRTIQNAYDLRASDIHFEPEEAQGIIRYRIDGILHDHDNIPTKTFSQLISKIKVESKLRIDEHLSAQDGRMSIKLEREDLDIRVSVVPLINGESCVLRLLSSRSRQFGLNDLGLQEDDKQKIINAYKKPYGMVLCTGPTGSGKTTTIYSILKLLNTRDRKIETIEDPVEYYIEGINQIQVNNKTNLTFSEGLRSILRQDPDIIFIGEIRDEETAEIAISSAMTGHLVLSTLHTNDAPTALPRLIDMKVEPFLVSSSVSVIIAQRLVRKVCDSCKLSHEINPSEIFSGVSKALLTKHFGNLTKSRVYTGKGCPVCQNTGYKGRVGVFEVMEITDKLREVINKQASADVLRDLAIKEGMQTMFEDGLEKIKLGLTTPEEVLRVTKE